MSVARTGQQIDGVFLHLVAVEHQRTECRVSHHRSQTVTVLARAAAENGLLVVAKQVLCNEVVDRNVAATDNKTMSRRKKLNLLIESCKHKHSTS